MIKLPYGLADFYDLITHGYLYVDRTEYLRNVEAFGRALLFVRPRRFGKSLWLQTLRCYYDLRLGTEFERLFGDLAIGREPTPLHNRYFVLTLNFSEVDSLGSIETIGQRLGEHVNAQIRGFLLDYRDHLGDVELDPNPAVSLTNLLAAIRQTPWRLYLLIDEYDNFVNEAMAKDAGVYRGLVQRDGPFKQLFKSLKAAMEGRGLERLFLTGVSPVALSDATSGFNIAENLYRRPAFNALCGFTERDLREILRQLALAGQLEEERIEPTLELMRVWYNGYCFASGAKERVYNPTNCLYLLKYLQQEGELPRTLQDSNLAADEGKLHFLGGVAASSQVVIDLLQDNGEIEVASLEERFTLRQLADKETQDPSFIASFLYYFGLLTEVGEARQHLALGIPNLVVKKLYAEHLSTLLLPRGADRGEAGEHVRAFLGGGELAPFLAFVETKLFRVFSHRDYRWANAQAIKAAFLALLFDDTRYAVFSELELARGHADLCLLLRPDARAAGAFDLLFEFKYVRPQELGLSSEELSQLSAAQLSELPPVAEALRTAHTQLVRYREAFVERFGEAVRPRCYAVVALGFERLVGEMVG
ncbi:MAG: AAA family ATPase [Thermoanaerobaculia bacterium]|nr:AAA family ATPase [Thermoanaerobaculia bacterium]